MPNRVFPHFLPGDAAIFGVGLLLCLLVSGCQTGQGTDFKVGALVSESTLDPKAAQLAADLQRWEGFGFSGAVLVARHGEILFSSGYGYANRARRIPVTPQTQFDIASVGKSFTAAAILVLADAGKLKISESISAVIPDVPPDKAAITVHHLLTHTSGISDFGNEQEPVARNNLIGQILAAPLESQPGSTYAYSNLGYNLLAAIVEMVSGQLFEDYLTQVLFEPAGLQRTVFSWVQPAGNTGQIALGYGGYGYHPEGENPRERPDTWRRRGSGDVLSTTEDLLRWYRALRTGRILSKASLDLMFTAHTVAEADFLSYGYGWRMQSTTDGKRLIWHSGLEPPYSAMFRDYTEEGLVLVFLSNQSIGGVPMREILVPPSRSGPPSSQLFAKAVSAVPSYTQQSTDLSSYGGRYRTGTDSWWHVETKNGGAVLRAEGQEAVDALFPPKDPSIAASYQKASAEAMRMAECLLDDACPQRESLKLIDPHGYANRDRSKITAQWRHRIRQDGELLQIRNLGTTGLRGRRSSQKLTHLRLVFARGVLDETVIWYADDEIYWIQGRPATLAIRFKPQNRQGLIGFDLLKQRVYRAALSSGEQRLTIRVGSRVVKGNREP